MYEFTQILVNIFFLAVGIWLIQKANKRKKSSEPKGKAGTISLYILGGLVIYAGVVAPIINALLPKS